MLDVDGVQLRLHEDPEPTEGLVSMPDQADPVQTGSRYATQGRNE